MRSHMSPVHFKHGTPLTSVMETTSSIVWTAFLNGLVQYTECCDPLVSYCHDSLVVGFRGSLEIYFVIQEENEALLRFDHYEASLMDEDNLL